MARVVITNHGNVAAKGTTTVALSASPTMNVAGTGINSLARNLNIRANGGTATVLVAFKALPNLADGDYYIVASVTDPFGGTSVASSAGTTHIAAPFVSLALAFGSIPPTVLAAGAPLILTNGGNIDDNSVLTATIGFSTDSGGANIIGASTGKLAPARVIVRANKTAHLHVAGWNALLKTLPSQGPLFLTVTVTDAEGRSASVVSSAPIASQ
jgi:hypothetical protein